MKRSLCVNCIKYATKQNHDSFIKLKDDLCYADDENYLGEPTNYSYDRNTVRMISTSSSL